MPIIKIKGSSTASSVPSSLAQRELAVNVTDKKMYVGDGFVVQKIVGSLGNQEANAVAITGGTVTGITDLAVADGGTGASTAAQARTNLGVTATGSDTTYAFRANNLSDLSNVTTARTNLGLGTMAVQNANTVNITGGIVSGITDLAVADGGTGASTAADARTNLDVPSRTGSDASGTWGISITGNAATATNGVVTTGSYANPTWLTSLGWAKVTGTPSTLSGYGITDGVSTSGSYSNPTWITSISGSIVSGNITGNAANVTGTVAVANGGTGATTAATARANILPSYATNATKILAVNAGETDVAWVTAGGGGIGDVVGPASSTDNAVARFDGTTGKLIQNSAFTVNDSGEVMAGTWTANTIGRLYGGTGQTSYTNGQLLIGNTSGGLTKATLTAGSNITITNGDGAITIASTGGGTPGGSNTEIQFNNSGSFGGSSRLTWSSGTNSLWLNYQTALRFYDSFSATYVAFRAATNVPSSVTWTLPSADGSSGQVLSTNGAGTLSWATASGGGSSTILENDSTISTSYTLTTGKNGLSVGPVTINTGVAVTVPTDHRWVVIVY